MQKTAVPGKAAADPAAAAAAAAGGAISGIDSREPPAKPLTEVSTQELEATSAKSGVDAIPIVEAAKAAPGSAGSGGGPSYTVGQHVVINLPNNAGYHNFNAEIKWVSAKTVQVVMLDGPKKGSSSKFDKQYISLVEETGDPAAKKARTAAMQQALKAFGPVDDVSVRRACACEARIMNVLRWFGKVRVRLFIE